MNYGQSDGAGAESEPLFAGAVRLRQTATGHRVGTDAVLLAAAAPVVDGLILDAGAGVGAVGIAVALRAPAATLELVDADPAACALARENVASNGLAGRARVVQADLLSAGTRRSAGLLDSRAALVLCNPPFYDSGAVRASPDAARARAHVAESGLEPWIRMAAALAAPDGWLALIHRADKLGDILAICAGRFGDLRIAPIYPKQGVSAIRVVVRGRKGSRAAPMLRPGLVLHGADGRFTEPAETLHRGRALLSMD